jgi:IstB-like ATP binding protein
VLGDPTIADAILDRLVHTAHRIALDGETLRKPQEKSGKRSKLDTGTAEWTLESRRRDHCPGSSECCPRSIGTPVRNPRNPHATEHLSLLIQQGLHPGKRDEAGKRQAFLAKQTKIRRMERQQSRQPLAA